MTDHTEKLLLDAVIAAPDDESRRLAYADHLSAGGNPRGEFIRIDCEMERMLAADPDCDGSPRWKELDARRIELINAHNEAWLAPLAALGVDDPGDVTQYKYGFVEYVTLADSELLTHRAAELFAALPLLRDVGIEYGVSVDAAALAARPETARLRSLSISGGGLAADALEDFISVPLPALQTLELSGAEYGERGAAVLARGRFPALRKLGVDYCKLGRKGAEALAAAPYLAQLAELDLHSNDTGPEGLERLLAIAGFAPANLNLDSNKLGPEGLELLARWAGGRALRELRAGMNNGWSDGAAAIAGSPHLAGLTYLDLANNELEPEGAAALAGGRFAALKTLNLSTNGIGDAGAAALAAAQWPALQTLELTGNYIRDAGFAALATAAGMPRLRKLDVYDNRVGSAGAAALAKSPLALTKLRLQENRIGPEGVAALVASPLWPLLVDLDLQDNPIGPAGPRTLAGAVPGPALKNLWLSPKGLDKPLRAALRERFGEALNL